MSIAKLVDDRNTKDMRNKLKSYGIDTNLDKSPTLTIGTNTKENYHQLLRVLKRLTSEQKITYPFTVGLYSTFARWRTSLPSNLKDFKKVSQEDLRDISGILEFGKRKIKPCQTIMNDNTLLSIYEGQAYRQRRIYVGEMSRPISLPSGQRVERVILISKEVAIFLNWLEAHFPFGKEQKSWKSIYKDATDKTYFGVICHFITNKLDHMNAQYHRRPLDEIFNQFYLDYIVSYSGVMQRRVDEKLRSESIATAYLTKKNIPEDIKDIMKNTKLLEMFDYVEIDEDLDKDLFNTFERDVLYFKDDPLFKTRVSSLRIRKLGKHSSEYKTTKGLYYPSLDNISVDLEGLSSFVHEWGHAVDTQLGRPSTTNEEFLEKIHLQVVKGLYKSTKLDPRQIQYFTMPSEVFARAFEWYINDKYQPKSNAAIKENREYNKLEEYKIFNKMDVSIKTFFSNLEGVNKGEIV